MSSEALLWQRKILSPIGPLYLVASEIGLRGIFYNKQKLSSIGKNKFAKIHLDRAENQLREYFKKERQKFNLKLDIQGTPFQKKVWHALASIPYSQTLSYKDLAEKISHPQAFRAVGNANGKNPFCVALACHRVIAANGGQGGYSGGLWRKKFLLNLESG